MSESLNNQATIDRLLQIAVEVFAESGFKNATVRDICKKAQVNVASINYYFRSKEALYTQALSFAFAEANRLYPQDEVWNVQLPPEQRLGLLIANFLHRLLNLGLHTQLIANEIANPSHALDEIISTAIAPQCALLQEIVELIVGVQADKSLIDRCVLSILGQCLFFKHSRAVIDRLYPELIADEAMIQATAEHICQFSLAALYELKKGGAS